MSFKLSSTVIALFFFAALQVGTPVGAQTQDEWGRSFTPQEVRTLKGELAFLAQRNHLQLNTLRAIAREIGASNRPGDLLVFVKDLNEKALKASELETTIATLREKILSLSDRSTTSKALDLLELAKSEIDEGKLSEAESNLTLLAKTKWGNSLEARDAWRQAILTQASVIALRRTDKAAGEFLESSGDEERAAWARSLWPIYIQSRRYLKDDCIDKDDYRLCQKSLDILLNKALPLTSPQLNRKEWAETKTFISFDQWYLSGSKHENKAMYEASARNMQDVANTIKPEDDLYSWISARVYLEEYKLYNNPSYGIVNGLISIEQYVDAKQYPIIFGSLENDIFDQYRNYAESSKEASDKVEYYRLAERYISSALAYFKVGNTSEDGLYATKINLATIKLSVAAYAGDEKGFDDAIAELKPMATAYSADRHPSSFAHVNVIMSSTDREKAIFAYNRGSYDEAVKYCEDGLNLLRNTKSSIYDLYGQSNLNEIDAAIRNLEVMSLTIEQTKARHENVDGVGL